MIIRAATVDDAAAIAEFWNPMIRNSSVTFNSIEKTADDIADMIQQRLGVGYGFLVAEDAGSVIGFATYSQFRGGIGYAHTMEHTVIIAPVAQGNGAGRLLMGAIERHAKDFGAHSIFAGVSSENLQGVGFHTAMGYKEVAVLPRVGNKFGRWMDLHLMQKFL